jgi:hypothetical protein
MELKTQHIVIFLATLFLYSFLSDVFSTDNIKNNVDAMIKSAFNSNGTTHTIVNLIDGMKTQLSATLSVYTFGVINSLPVRHIFYSFFVNSILTKILTIQFLICFH